MDQSSAFFIQAKETVVYNTVYRLSISLSVPEMFAVKFKSCFESSLILNVFALPILKRVVLFQSCTST